MRKLIGSIAIIAVIVLAVYLIMQAMGTRDVGADKQNAQPFDQTISAPPPPQPITAPSSEEDEKARQLKEHQQSLSGEHEMSKLYLVKCSACHGRDGSGPVGPSIAGKNKEENLAILMKYKNNEVKNTMMRGLLDKTAPAELEMLAEEISSF